MSMTPEEILHKQIWEILQDIKEEILVTNKGDPVKYRIPNIIGVGIIPSDRKKKILHKLEEQGVLKIHRNSNGARIGTNDLFYFYINEQKFSEFYNKYNPNDTALKIEKNQDQKREEEPLDVIIADLEAKYEDTLQEKSEGNFYLKLADYGKYVIDHQQIHFAINPLYQQSQRDVVDYKKASDVFMDKWKTLAKDLVETAEKAGMSDHPTSPFINQINEIKGKMNENPSYDDDYLSYYFRPYRELTKRFKDEGKFDLITPMHFFTNKERGIEYLLLQSEYSKAQGEWEKFKRLREMQPWWAHYQIMRLAHGVFNLADRGEYFHNDNMIDLIYLYEFQQISQGKTDLVILRRARFEEWVKRFQKFLSSRLKSAQSSRNIKEQTTQNKEVEDAKHLGSNKLIFYAEDGITEYRTARYTFKGKTRALLEFLCKSKNTPFSLDDIKTNCNQNISNSKHHFKGDKDMRDTVNYIREMLKVNEGEFFPIYKRENNWIWLEK